MRIIRNSALLLLASMFFLLPSFLQGSLIKVRTVSGAEDIPEKFCTIWKEGDFLISDGKYLALVGGTERPLVTFNRTSAKGCILSLVPSGKGALNNMGIGAPILRLKDKTYYLSYSSVVHLKSKGTENLVHFLATAPFEAEKGIKATVKTLYTYFPLKGKIEITSSIKNRSKKELKEINFSLYTTGLHRYYFSPFNPEKQTQLNFHVYQKKGHCFALVNLNEYRDDSVPGKLGPGETFTLRYVLVADTSDENVLREVYRILKVKTFPALINIEDFNGNLMEIMIKNIQSGSTFYRSFLEKKKSLKIPLPPGVYSVRANLFPAVVESFFSVNMESENSCTISPPPLEKVRVKIIDRKGRHVPGKVTFIGLQPTESPYFKPENPVMSGRRWETFKNSVFPPSEGMEVELPAGKYLIYASRGPEYTIDHQITEVLRGEPQEINFSIERVIQLKHLISMDPHMHTTNSDGRMGIEERIKSVVAEGVDVAVATDHNYITDYNPFLRELGFEKYLAVFCGNEVSARGVIHYNSYPLKFRPEEENNGAISLLEDEASTLFKASREKEPEAIIQVNHPRSGSIGYFNNYSLDPESAAYALSTFDTSFDVLEVMNGPYFYYRSNKNVVEDWLHLLNRGYFFPLVGSSDSHTIDRGEPGYSRTYIYYKGKKGEELERKKLVEAIKKGHSFTTNGPIILVKANGRYMPGETFTSPSGKIVLECKVLAAPWIRVDEIRLIINGKRERTIPLEAEKNQKQHPFRVKKKISLKLEKDSYLAAEVLGRKSLYPVLQRSSLSGEMEDAALPYALTNPIFVDVDGNKKFDPPLASKIKLIEKPVNH
ncbi:MAG: CehA/McbA family metallohydrolase [Candidatus Aminicenantales bacterium]